VDVPDEAARDHFDVVAADSGIARSMRDIRNYGVHRRQLTDG